MSRGRVVRRCRTEVDSTPQTGHAAAVGSSVTRCTIRPGPTRTTDWTRTPGRPNRIVVLSPMSCGSLCWVGVRTASIKGPQARSAQARRAHQDQTLPRNF
jgi:hypothetical protein